ncbi:MAG: septum formation inhibitor Maf [Caldithrix sp.]|nr:MAG: septum formation inhibitor Maf [Caldithrix sp.]
MKILNALKFIFVLILALNLSNCSSVDSKENKTASRDRDAFNKYWYAGKAEITRYALDQARYGEIRKGDAVLIFVTEPFLTDKQVKHEFGDSKNSVSVLKLNSIKKFYTGIYPYSMMTSVFTPVAVSKQPTLKVTSSSQEWCGQTFMQLNNREGKIEALLHSYFQSEGEQNFKLDAALLEDEVWTRIRLAPESLPTGKIEIIPGLQFARLRHTPLKVEKATAKLSTAGELQVYTIEYKKLKRKLVIKFEKDFPHRIIAWEESQMSGYGPSAKMLTTRAVKTHSILSDYWSKNRLSDSHLKDELGLIY